MKGFFVGKHPFLGSISKPQIIKVLSQGVVVGLLLVVFFVPLFFSPMFHEYEVPKLAILKITTVFILVIWVVGMALDGKISVIDTSLYYTILVFLAINFISLFQAYNIFQGLNTLFDYMCYLLISILVFHNIRSPKQIYLLTGVMAFTGGTVALIGMLQYNGIIRLYAPWNIPISTIGNVNFVSEYYDVVFPLCLTQIFLFRNIWLQIISVLAGFLMVCHLIVLNSRGGWLGAVVSLSVLGGMVLFRHFRIDRRFVDIIIVMFVTVGLSLPVIEGLMSVIQVGPEENFGGMTEEIWKRMKRRTGEAIKLKDDSSLQRTNLWADTVQLILDRPLVGVGVGNYEYNIPKYLSRKSLELKGRMESKTGKELMVFRAHNEFLEMWAEIGILGMLVFGFLLFQIGLALCSLLRGYIRGESNLLPVGLASAIVSSLIHCFFSTNLQDPASAVSFWIVVGVIWSLKLDSEKSFRIGLLATGTGWSVFGLIVSGSLVLIGTIFFSVQILLGDYHFFKGTSLFKAGFYEKASAEFNRAVNFRPPKLFAAYQAMGLSYYNKNQWPEAVLALKQSIFFHRNNATAYYYLGLALGNMERYSEAEIYLQRAVNLNPISARFRRGLGEVLGLDGNLNRAVEELQESLRLDPNSSEVYHVLGGNYKRIGDLEAAVEAYKEALILEPGNSEIQNSLGVVSLLLGDFEGARETFLHLVQDNLDRIDYRMNLGVVFLNLGQIDSVLFQCRKILQVSPNHLGAYTLMGDAFQINRKPSLARQVYLEALKQDTENSEIQERLKALEVAP